MPFREPVNWREMGLADYPVKVKVPMDLGTVKTKLERNVYRTADECASDVRLVWKNCMTYNEKGSDLYRSGKELSRKFEEKYDKFVPAQNRGADGQFVLDIPPSTQEKQRFGKNMYRVRTEDLNEIVSILDSQCPACLQKVDGTDELEINLDVIDGRTFQQISKVVANCLPTAKPTSTFFAPRTSSSGKNRNRPTTTAGRKAQAELNRRKREALQKKAAGGA